MTDEQTWQARRRAHIALAYANLAVNRASCVRSLVRARLLRGVALARVRAMGRA